MPDNVEYYNENIIVLSTKKLWHGMLTLLKSFLILEAEINYLLMTALREVLSSLSNSLIVDKWRWSVYKGYILRKDFNLKWWELRERYQGIKAPVERDVDNVDLAWSYHFRNDVASIMYV